MLGRVVRTSIAVAAIAISLALAGCGGGQSGADQAKTEACNASVDIQAQIATIQGLSTGKSSLDDAKAALHQIEADLKTIQEQAPKATGDLSTRLTKANESFRSELESALSNVASAQSFSAAAADITSAADALAASYKSAFGDVGC
jgi:hypothetical protein